MKPESESRPRCRQGRRPAREMAEIKERALHLIKTNPTLSMTVVAKHFGVSQLTVSRWFDQAGLKRWF